MTDFKDGEKASQKEPSFKDKILAELEEANRLRQEREEELRRKQQEAQEAAQRQAEQEAKLAEEARLEEERLLALKRQEAERLAVAKALIEQQKAEEERLLRERQEAQKQAIAQEVEMQRLAAEKQAKEAQEAIDAAKMASLSLEETSPVDKEIVKPELPTASTFTIEETVQNQEQTTVPQLEENDAEIVAPKLVAKSESTKDVFEELEKEVPSKRQRKNKIATKISAILITVIILVGCLAGFFGYRYVTSALGAADKTAKKYVTVDIPVGSGNKYIGQILQKSGVIKDATVFNYYTKFKNISNLQSGYYNLKASMTVEEIVKSLQKGGTAQPEQPVAGKILVTEGYTIKQIAEAITKNVNTSSSSKTPFSADDFLALMKDDTFIAKMVAKYPDLLSNLPSADTATYQLEGYLFPATYNYYDDTTLEGLVEEMISTMNSYLSSYYTTIKSSGYNVNQILTLASLVEKEGSTDDDRRNIASVFYNRLNSNMPLQSNIAILYAMGKLGEATTLKEDTTIDTAIDSPYNIYTNTGLMPGPVDSPSLSAIEATIQPASTNYLYFVADVKTGKVYYSEDYDTHLQNVEKYINSQVAESSN